MLGFLSRLVFRLVIVGIFILLSVFCLQKLIPNLDFRAGLIKYCCLVVWILGRRVKVVFFFPAGRCEMDSDQYIDAAVVFVVHLNENG